jgi:hypothetical protein
MTGSSANAVLGVDVKKEQKKAWSCLAAPGAFAWYSWVVMGDWPSYVARCTRPVPFVANGRR